MDLIRIDNHIGKLKLSKDETLFLYKLAMNLFEADADGCEIILEDMPEYDLKVSIDFTIREKDEQ